MRKWTRILSAMFLLAAVSAVHAQQGPPGGGPGGGGGQGGGPGGGPDGGPPDPEEMMQRMEARIKTALQADDSTWAKLQPAIHKVEDLAHQTDTGPLMHGRPHRPDEDQGGPGGGQGGDGDDDDDHPRSPIETAIANLKKVLMDKSSTDDAIAAAMKTAEDAEKKAKEDLASARKELKAETTPRQQAVLVATGVLD